MKKLNIMKKATFIILFIYNLSLFSQSLEVTYKDQIILKSKSISMQLDDYKAIDTYDSIYSRPVFKKNISVLLQSQTSNLLKRDFLTFTLAPKRGGPSYVEYVDGGLGQEEIKDLPYLNLWLSGYNIDDFQDELLKLVESFERGIDIYSSEKLNIIRETDKIVPVFDEQRIMHTNSTLISSYKINPEHWGRTFYEIIDIKIESMNPYSFNILFTAVDSEYYDTVEITIILKHNKIHQLIDLLNLRGEEFDYTLED